MTITGTFDNFRSIINNFKKPIVVFLEPGGTVFVIEPTPTESAFFIGIPDAVSVNKIGG